MSHALQSAIDHHRQGRLAEAERLYRSVLAQEPHQFDALHFLGLLRLQQGGAEEACALISKAVATRPDATNALSNLSAAQLALGRYEQALATCDRVLKANRNDVEALCNRAAALMHLARLEEAVACYDQALRQRPDHVNALFNRATCLARLSRFEEALAGCDRVLALVPQHVDALNNRGNILSRLGRHADALASYDRALALQGGRADILVNRATVLRSLGRHQEALDAVARVLAAKPDHVAALNTEGTILLELNRPQEALTRFEKASAASPNDVELLDNIALALYRIGRYAEALRACQSALAVKPDHVDALFRLGIVLQALERHSEALQSYERALAIRPDHVESRSGRGNALLMLDRLDEALASYDDLLAWTPDHTDTQYNRSVALCAMGRPTEAADGFRRVLTLDPDRAEAKFGLCMAQLPIIYAGESEVMERRAAYRAQLEALHQEVAREATPARFIGAVGRMQPFYLAYQGLDDRELQSRYGAVVSRIVADRYPAATLAAPPGADERVRIGIVSGYFRAHSAWKVTVKGWLSQLDRTRFLLFGYHTGGARDVETEVARGLCEKFVQGPMPVERWRAAIMEDAPHVLIYPEVGMDATVPQLAAQRLAPVQCMSWGHPETSGFPTLDYYLTSDLMEPANGDEHYTERLIRLPNLSSYYEPFEAVAGDAAELGLAFPAVKLWCGQSLFKYLPQFDHVFPDIAARAGDCRFVFIRDRSDKVTEVFRGRLERAFAAAGLKSSDFCMFLPRLDQRGFAAATGCCDIFLDSLGWSGFNTTLESLPHDLPIVTMPGALMRARHSAALLTMMDVTETIADTIESYISVAARLVKDAAWRSAIKVRMAANKQRVYRDRQCIDALEEFLDRVARQQREC